MKLRTQKRLASTVLKCSPKRVKFNLESLEKIKAAIRKFDIKGLIKEKSIIKIQKKGVSRVRANKIKSQKSKGRRKGDGSAKGVRRNLNSNKRAWINKIRSQRELIKRVRENETCSKETCRDLYRKAGGGFFRNTRHIKLYIKDHNLITKK